MAQTPLHSQLDEAFDRPSATWPLQSKPSLLGVPTRDAINFRSSQSEGFSSDPSFFVEGILVGG